MKFTDDDIVDGFLQILGFQSAAQKQKEQKRRQTIDEMLKQALNKFDPQGALQHNHQESK